eukprot:scaffold212044_cov67-Cyclotella_meneghiniana.AAC.3
MQPSIKSNSQAKPIPSRKKTITISKNIFTRKRNITRPAHPPVFKSRDYPTYWNVMSYFNRCTVPPRDFCCILPCMGYINRSRPPLLRMRMERRSCGEFGTQMTLKTALILTQLVGYLSSKFIGIKVTSESKGKQDYILVALCLFSEASLILFGLLGTYATDWCFIAMFLNGLPLGMVWGLVVSYFEGRADADFMMVALCISFIVGSGVVKDVALALLDAGYSQFWVPAIEGAMFAVLWLICIVGLNQLPPPSEVDKSERGERISMDHSMRLEYYLTFWPGLLALWLGAMCLTAYRD